MRNQRLLKIGYLCGLIPLLVGLIIFFAWWIARAWFAYDFHSLEGYGFLWLIISVPVAIVGLLILLYFIIRNYPNHLKQPILGLLLILINIPGAKWVMEKQGDIDMRAYVKFNNQTNEDNVELTLKGSDFEKHIGSFDNGGTIIDFYYPKYLYEREESGYMTIDTVKLLVKDKFTTFTLTLPRIDKGDCVKLHIDKDFKLEEQ